MTFFPIVPPAASSVAPSYSYRGFTADTANLSTYTFSSHDIGTAAASRRVVVCAYGVGGSASSATCTVGGISATALVTATLQFYSPGYIFIAEVPTGTTADIVVTFSAGAVACGVAVYAVYDLTSSSAVDTGSGTGSFNDTLTSVNPGVAIGCSLLNSAAASTWTNLTEDHDTVVETNSQMSSAAALTSATSINIQRSPTAANNNTTICVTLQ